MKSYFVVKIICLQVFWGVFCNFFLPLFFMWCFQAFHHEHEDYSFISWFIFKKTSNCNELS